MDTGQHDIIKQSPTAVVHVTVQILSRMAPIGRINSPHLCPNLAETAELGKGRRRTNDRSEKPATT